MTRAKPSKRKPRITREQAIEQAVRYGLHKHWGGTVLVGAKMIAATFDSQGAWATEQTFTQTIPAIRAEFARLTQ